jgi:predicted esterase
MPFSLSEHTPERGHPCPRTAQERLAVKFSIAFLTVLLSAVISAADDRPWPKLPDENGTARLPAQAWGFQEGPREITAYVYYPGKRRANLDEKTGLFLALHYWSGTHADGVPDPQTLADRYNVVAICVDYLQSGPYDGTKMPPYDYGYLQALDALRSLHWMYSGLQDAGTDFHTGRIYCTGYSGGGNVTQMANKMAPRTFAAIIDFCGMAKLTDDIAFNLEGGSPLNAGYSQDPTNPAYLSFDAQVIRDLGHPDHLEQMKELGQEAHIFVVHGATDDVCPVEDKRAVVANMRAAGLPVTARYPEEKDLDGVIFTGTGHGMGDPTKMLEVVADPQLLPESPEAAIRKGACDFERKDVIRYATPNGHWEISYDAGFPVGRFVEK